MEEEDLKSRYREVLGYGIEFKEFAFYLVKELVGLAGICSDNDIIEKLPFNIDKHMSD